MSKKKLKRWKTKGGVVVEERGRALANTDSLVKYATTLGASCALIEDRDGCPEVLVGGWGVMRLAEVKTAKGKLRERQEKWRQRWRGPPPHLWRTLEDVERTLQEMRIEAVERSRVGRQKQDDSKPTANVTLCGLCGREGGDHLEGALCWREIRAFALRDAADKATSERLRTAGAVAKP